MKLALTLGERNKVMLDILCNGAISFLAQSDVDMEYSLVEYKNLKKEGMSYEEVLLELINSGGKLDFIDSEGEFSSSITSKSLEKCLTNIIDEFLIENVLTLLNESGDAENGLIVLQFILYNEVIFVYPKITNKNNLSNIW